MNEVVRILSEIRQEAIVTAEVIKNDWILDVKEMTPFANRLGMGYERKQSY